jgi:hypothetical protein
MIHTPLSEPIYRDPAVLALRRGMVLLRRIGVTQDIADAVVFLVARKS